jgi:hypothetical protein
LPLELFNRYFGELIRVELEWSLVTPRTHSVRVSMVDSANEFDRWYFPWYFDPESLSGSSVDDSCSIPHEVKAVKSRWGLLDGERRRAIERVTHDITASGVPARLVLATYVLPDGGRLVMDGNHRLAGLKRFDVDFVAMEFALQGPIRPEILPDLRFWTAG